MWGHMNNWGWGGMGWGMLLFWAALIVGIVWLVKAIRSPNGPADRRPEKSALDILQERYARGEIDREEFEQKKHDLAE